WSEAKGNPQMKLQGSDTQSIKTLQSENAPQPKSRFPISGLAFLHGRLRNSRSSPDEPSDIRGGAGVSPRISRSLSSGAHPRDPLAHPGYKASRVQCSPPNM
ncbi:MAG TPA: hypothetical protein VMT08_01605, partial [Bradyrhizobium sp.]|nr:hypothetical protein [Bradyrhizobium sp.]